MSTRIFSHAARPAGIASVSAAAAARRCAMYAFEVVRAWMERARQRRQLGTLNDRLFKDIGVTRRRVERELAKPFWRP